MRIIADNLVDIATLTANPAVVATLPVTNLQKLAHSKTMRTTSTADQEIKMTFASDKVFTAFAMLRHNLTSSATWRIQIYSDAAWTTQVFDSADTLALPGKALGDLLWGVEPLGVTLFTGWAFAFSTMWLSSAVNGRSVKITIKDSTNPAGYFDVGRLFAGSHIESNINPKQGMDLKWIDPSKQSRTSGATLYSEQIGEPYRELQIDLDALSPESRSKLNEASRQVGMRKDIFISVFPGYGGAIERDYTLQGKFVKTPNSRFEPGVRFSSGFTIQDA